MEAWDSSVFSFCVFECFGRWDWCLCSGPKEEQSRAFLDSKGIKEAVISGHALFFVTRVCSFCPPSVGLFHSYPSLATHICNEFIVKLDFYLAYRMSLTIHYKCVLLMMGMQLLKKVLR